MKRVVFLVYATTAYAIALANIAYIMGFLADFGVPKGINDGSQGDVLPSMIVNTVLVLMFGLHHSLTARRSFKRWWMQWIPAPIERATYLYMTAAMTFIVVALWRPIPETVWHVSNGFVATVIVSAYLLAWLMMFAATFHFGHLGFFGVRDAWNNFRQKPPAESGFAARYLYALVRHPISLGWMLTPWLTPHMTVGQLVWAVSVTAYVMVATVFEERDLIEELGAQYEEYRQTVRRFLPGPVTAGAGQPHRGRDDQP